MDREKLKSCLLSARKTPFGYEPLGSPFIIKLTVTNTKELVKTLSSGELPFKIFGIVSRVNKNVYVVYGTDLENGCPLEMEIAPTWLVVHLRRVPNDNNGEDCVDTLLRLFDNIKNCVDENATLECEGS